MGAHRDDKAFDPVIGQLWDIYDQTKVEPDVMKRHQMVWDMIKIHVENGPYVQGTVANFERVYIVKNGLMNVPRKAASAPAAATVSGTAMASAARL